VIFTSVICGDNQGDSPLKAMTQTPSPINCITPHIPFPFLPFLYFPSSSTYQKRRSTTKAVGQKVDRLQPDLSTSHVAVNKNNSRVSKSI